ncbi:MAG: O-antigen ligase family protein [Prevotellaceae bacterium]|jgi:O-antigen ligase|nr:O-antigen ligase family protein [Prevotellaceae bacterium]
MKKLISILLSILIVLLPFGAYAFDGIFRKQEVILCSCILLSVILLAYIVFLIANKKRILISISIIDISVLAFFVYSVFHSFFVIHLQVSEILVYKWFAIFCVYVLCRIAAYKNILMYAIVLSGFIQSIIAALQKLYIIDSHNIFFDVTGTFNNPGILGGYVAVAFIIAVCLLKNAIKNRSHIKTIFLTVSVLFLFAAVIFSDSRAAFTAVSVGIAMFYFHKIRHVFIRHKIIFSAIFCVFLIFTGVLLFNYRQGSANSRLLIWRVSVEMIADKPLFGRGIASFDSNYMHCQAAYFDKNPDSKFIPVADNVAYAYNEFIHIAVETGITGLLFLLSVFYSAFSSKKQRLQKVALVALLVFSMFSYPAEIFPLLLLFPAIIGCFNTKPFRKEIRLRHGILLIAGIALLSIIYLNIRSELYFGKAAAELVQTRENKEQLKEYICKYYKRLKYNPEFCRIYAIWINENISENEIFNVLELFPTSESYCLFGERYVQKALYGKAEQCFKTAASMTPNRILPNYGLFKLYQKLGNEKEAILMANKILNQHIKIDNTQTVRILFEIENWLNRIKTK